MKLDWREAASGWDYYRCNVNKEDKYKTTCTVGSRTTSRGPTEASASFSVMTLHCVNLEADWSLVCDELECVRVHGSPVQPWEASRCSHWLPMWNLHESSSQGRRSVSAGRSCAVSPEDRLSAAVWVSVTKRPICRRVCFWTASNENKWCSRMKRHMHKQTCYAGSTWETFASSPLPVSTRLPDR